MLVIDPASFLGECERYVLRYGAPPLAPNGAIAIADSVLGIIMARHRLIFCGWLYSRPAVEAYPL